MTDDGWMEKKTPVQMSYYRVDPVNIKTHQIYNMLNNLTWKQTFILTRFRAPKDNGKHKKTEIKK